MSLTYSFIDYDLINNEIQQVLENFKIPSNWSEILNFTDSFTTENFNKYWNPIAQTVSETNFYFDTPIHLIHYNSDFTLRDVRRVYRAYCQTVDIGSKYTLLHYINHYKPWPDKVIRQVLTLQDLLPPESYIFIDLHDIDYFKAKFLNNITMIMDVIDKDNVLRGDYLLVIWYKLYGSISLSDNMFKSNNIPIVSITDAIKTGYKKLVSSNKNPSWSLLSKLSSYPISYQNSTFISAWLSRNVVSNYWLLHTKIDWVGLLPRILQRFDNFNDGISILGIMNSTIESNPSQQQAHKIIDRNPIRNAFCKIEKFLKKHFHLDKNAKFKHCQSHSKVVLNEGLPMIGLDLSRYSNAILNLMFDNIQNGTHNGVSRDTFTSFIIQSSFSGFSSKKTKLSSRDILKFGLDEGLLNKNFLIPSASVETEFRENELLFKSYDVDTLFSRGGILYRLP